MIVGIGTDILDIRRIQHLIDKFSLHFLKKYFTEQELKFCNTRSNYIESLAKIFSIKEAVIKAIENKAGMKWHYLEITHNSFGAPKVHLQCDKYGKIPNEKYNIQVSTSDEYPYVVSFAILDAM